MELINSMNKNANETPNHSSTSILATIERTKYMQRIFIFIFSFEKTFSQGNELYFYNDLKAFDGVGVCVMICRIHVYDMLMSIRLQFKLECFFLKISFHSYTD